MSFGNAPVMCCHVRLAGHEHRSCGCLWFLVVDIRFVASRICHNIVLCDILQVRAGAASQAASKEFLGAEKTHANDPPSKGLDDPTVCNNANSKHRNSYMYKNLTLLIYGTVREGSVGEFPCLALLH